MLFRGQNQFNLERIQADHTGIPLMCKTKRRNENDESEIINKAML
jgi:transposase